MCSFEGSEGERGTGERGGEVGPVAGEGERKGICNARVGTSESVKNSSGGISSIRSLSEEVRRVKDRCHFSKLANSLCASISQTFCSFHSRSVSRGDNEIKDM